MKKKIKAVIFDFDGVLCSDFFYNTLEHTNKEYYDKINKEIFQGSKDMIRSWMRGHIKSDDINSIISSRLNINKEILDQELSNSIKCMKLNPYLMQFIKELRASGAKTAIMTDNMDVFEELLVPTFKLNEYFDEIYSSPKYKRLKKDENWKNVHEVLEKLNCDMDEVLFIDDWDEVGGYVKSQNGNFYLYKRGNNELDFREFKKWFDENFYIKSGQDDNKTILVIAPHPDDELLGCGGSIIKAMNLGHDVHICFLSMGEFGSPDYLPEELSIIRKNEALMSCEFLRISNTKINFLEIKDNTICRYDLKAMRQLMKLIRNIQPNITYIPHKNESSSDHQETFYLSMRALDMAGSNNFLEESDSSWWVDCILAYEVWTPISSYNYAEDLSSETMKKKIEALKFYKSQSAESGNISDFISNKASFLPAFRAAMSIGEYREVFEVIRVNRLL